MANLYRKAKAAKFARKAAEVAVKIPTQPVSLPVPVEPPSLVHTVALPVAAVVPTVEAVKLPVVNRSTEDTFSLAVIAIVAMVNADIKRRLNDKSK